MLNVFIHFATHVEEISMQLHFWDMWLYVLDGLSPRLRSICMVLGFDIACVGSLFVFCNWLLAFIGMCVLGVCVY